MMQNGSKILILCLAISALLSIGVFYGCGSKEAKPQPPGHNFQDEFENAPDWVTKGCSAYWGDKASDKICGVGSMGGTRNISLARTQAVNRGRNEIASSLKVVVKRLVKDYQATVTGGENYGTASADEQYVSDTSKQITDQTLNGTEATEIWVSNSGTVYALVVMDTEKFGKAVSSMNNLDQKVREYVENNAQKAFDELDKATE